MGRVEQTAAADPPAVVAFDEYTITKAGGRLNLGVRPRGGYWRTCMRIIACSSVALLATSLIGCSKGEYPSTSASPAPKETAPEWTAFSHPQGKFAVLLPGVPQEMAQEVLTAAGKVKMTINVVELQGQAKAFGVVFADYPPGADYADEAYAHKVIDGVIGGIVSSLKGEVREKSKIQLNGHHGQECLMDQAGGDKRQLCRVYLVGNRLYQLIAGWSVARGDNSADAEKFMNSFKVTDGDAPEDTNEVNKQQLIGEWQVVKGPDLTPSMSIEFAKDGRFKLMEQEGPGLTKGGKKLAAKTVTVAEGRYTIDRNKLVMTAKQNDKEVKETRSIKTLTEKSLILADEKGTTSEFKKK
jgi:uncharacterized protein (TIGR03066 family)